MVRLETIDVPVLENRQLLGVSATKENAVAPGRRPLDVVDLLLFYVFVGRQEIDGALTVER